MLPTFLRQRGRVAVVCAALCAACERAPPPAQAPPGAPPVSVAAALEREVVVSDEFPGRIEAIETVQIRARVNGYLESIHFTPGTEVAKGDLLFVIDPRPFAARLAEAEAALATIRARLDLARTERARQARMLTDKATSQREYDAADAQVKTLEATVRANQASVESARLDLEYTRIVAPVAGRVGKEEVTVGNLVQGQGAESPVLTTIVSMDPIYVAFEADEQAFLKYIGTSRGAPLAVDVGLADESGFPHPARLEFVDNQLAATSGTVRMRAVLDNPTRRLVPGLFARVRLQAADRRRAVLVAARAIGTDQSKRYVLVVGNDQVATYREVHLGRQVGALRIVEQGLHTGEVIVVNGLQRVRPGSPVSPQLVPMEDSGGAAPDAAAAPGAG